MTPVDAAPPRNAEPPRAVMWPVSAIAARDGVSKQAVSRKVGKLAELGLTVERNAAGHVTAVNVVEYDRLRGRTDDPSKAQAPPRQAPQAELQLPPGETYNEALRQKTWLEAERRRIELEELKGELLRAKAVGEAAVAVAGQVAAICDRLPNAADELAAALEREGVHGLRVALKRIASRQRSEIADAMATIAAAAPKEELEEQAALAPS